MLLELVRPTSLKYFVISPYFRASSGRIQQDLKIWDGSLFDCWMQLRLKTLSSGLTPLALSGCLDLWEM
jgi:hypothetical protein